MHVNERTILRGWWKLQSEAGSPLISNPGSCFKPLRQSASIRIECWEPDYWLIGQSPELIQRDLPK